VGIVPALERAAKELAADLKATPEKSVLLDRDFAMIPRHTPQMR
jgi:hypothetical protein